MRTRNRKRAILVCVRGGLMVVLAVVLDAAGFLDRLESNFYAARVQHCQGYQPPPAASLVHLDIDDNALNDIGHWPWPRDTLCRIIDEIGRAQPKVVELDVIFDQPAPGDDQLAAAFRRLGCALVPVSLNFDQFPPDSKARSLLLPLLVDDPERTEAQCLDVLKPKGVSAADLEQDSRDSFSEVREAAFRQRIWTELTRLGSGTTRVGSVRDTIKRRMLPHDQPQITTVLDRLFDAEFARESRRWSVERFTLPLTMAGSTPVLSASAQLAPVPVIGASAALSGYVDYLPESVEATVREVPLLARYDDRLIPHMDLVAACAVLGADVRQIRLSDDHLVIPRGGKAADVVVPVSLRDSPIVGQVGALMELPLFGKPLEWQTMYDVPRHEKPERHISVDQVWQACETIDRLHANWTRVDALVRQWFGPDITKDADGLARYDAAPAEGEARGQMTHDVVEVGPGYIDVLTPDANTPDKKVALANAQSIQRQLPLLIAETDKLTAQLAQQRAGLRAVLHDRAIFFGGTATSLKDSQPTSLFGSTPGIVVHGAVFNAIVTGKMWRRAPTSWGIGITIAIGLVTLVLTIWLTPGTAFLSCLAVGVGYLALNGYFLFARHNLIIEAAGPVVAVGLVYVGMTLGNYLTEVADKARITRRLGKYVDPRVRDFLLAHPEHEQFDGEQKELTIGFSDLAGFTTLTDQLGERVVSLLADYVGRMIPVIQKHEGTFDKQIGDGLCFFFGAPIPDELHARRAVRTALAMHAGLAAFNGTLQERGFTPLGMRIGLATGEVIVGDAGAEGAASYTTLGGTTNLASRLEGANKNFGTRTLITARTVELLGDEFLCRPIANLRVVGKLNCTIVFEPLCLTAEATDDDRRLLAHTTAVFDAYRTGDFAACARAVVEMEGAFGPSKFTHLYAERAANPPDPAEHCDGQISLSEK